MTSALFVGGMFRMMMGVEPAPEGFAFAERRCSPRVSVALMGVCSINLGPDEHCTSIDMSIDGIALRTTALANIGDAVIASFREFGMAKGQVVRLFEGGFALALNKIDPYRSRLAQYLVWLGRGAERYSDEKRLHERIVPLNRILTVSRADGRTSLGRVENVSRSGIAFTSTATFEVDEAVRIGRHPATVVRVFEDGAAATFETILDADGFDVMISFAKTGDEAGASIYPGNRYWETDDARCRAGRGGSLTPSDHFRFSKVLPPDADIKPS